MALISAKTIITSLSLFHITLGFFFLTNPGSIADQTLVYVVGEAMGLPYARGFETQSPALAFLAVILAVFGVSDLVTLSLPEEVSLLHHWGLQGTLDPKMLLPFCCVQPWILTNALPCSADPRHPLVRPRLLYHVLQRLCIVVCRVAARPLHSPPTPPGYAPSGWGGDALKTVSFSPSLSLSSSAGSGSGSHYGRSVTRCWHGRQPGGGAASPTAIKSELQPERGNMRA